VPDPAKPADENQDPRVEAAMRDYLERIDRGEDVDREEFVSRYREVASAVRSFIEADEELRRLGQGSSPGADAKARSTDHLDRLTPEQRALVAERVQAFEAARKKGERPSIARYLPADPSVKTAALIELVHLDLKHRFDAGEPRPLAWYRVEFPALAEAQPQLSELVAVERELRRRFQATVTRAPDESQQAAAVAGDTVHYFGDYELLEEIARGGMGVVYKARQVSLNRMVALKMILAGQLASAREVDRFYTEAQAAANLRHPNIVTIHEVGQHAGHHYFSMDYVAGKSLAQIVREQPLAATHAAKYLKTIAEAIEFAHQHGTLHRDLKPANVLIDEFDQPRVTDFGLAKRIEGAGELTSTGTLMGTPSYMPPEQAGANDGKVGPASDVYSLGALLYDLVTGRPPFLGESLVATLNQVLHTEPLPPSLLNPELPRDLETICLKCLQKEPGKRYLAAAALADDLGRFLRREPILAQPVGTIERAWRWCRRNPVVSSLSTTIAVLLFAAAIGGSILAIRERNAHVAADQSADLARDAAHQERMQARRADANAQAEEKMKLLAQAEARRADEKADEVRHALYAARQQLAMNAWRENHADLLAEILERQRPEPGSPDLRGFEWAYLDCLAKAPGRRWRQIGPMVNGVAVSPNNLTAISVGFDGKGTAWNVETGATRWDTGDAFRSSVNAVAISPDRKTVALAGHFGQLRLYGIDGKPLAILDGHHAQVFGVAFSPNGKLLASAGADISVRLWEIPSGKAQGLLWPVRPLEHKRAVSRTDPSQSVGHTGMVWQAAWAPDGKRLASCSGDGTVKIWMLPERKLLRTLVGHEGLVVALAWSPDGRLIASVSRPLVGEGVGELKLWDPDTGRLEATMRPPSGGLHAVALTPDGLHVVTGGEDRTVRIWTKDGRLIGEQRGFHGAVIGLAIGGEGRWAVAGTRAGEVVAFELDSAPGKRDTAVYGPTLLGFAADGKLAAFHDGEVQWRDGVSLAEIARWPEATGPIAKGNAFTTVAAFALRTDGQTAHSGHGYIGPGTVVWRDTNGQVRHQLSGHTAPISAVAFMPRDRLASADEEGTIRIWEGATGASLVHLRPWEGQVRFLVVASDGRLWAGGAPTAPRSSTDRLNRLTSTEGRLARIEDGKLIWQTTTTSIPSAADLSANGKQLVVGSADGSLVWLDPLTGNVLHRLAASASGAIVSLRVSPGGRRIALGTAGGTVRLLDADSGDDLLSLNGPPAPVVGLGFSPDGTMIAAAASTRFGGNIMLWDARTATDPPPLPRPDRHWHEARLALASGAGDRFHGFGSRDPFAMRYHLNRLAALDPSDLKCARSLLALDQDAGDYGAAAIRLNDMVGHWPNDAETWYDLGNANRELGDVAGAESAFRKCIVLKPTYAQAHCNLGLLLGGDGRFREAVELLTRGHELGMKSKMAGKDWQYPSNAWLAHFKRLGELADRYRGLQDMKDVPKSDRNELIEVLTLTSRPLAAIRLADPNEASSPGPVVIGAAIRCAEGFGDAASLAPRDRFAWRAKALKWLRLDYAQIGSSDPAMCAAMRSHPLLRISQGNHLQAWPETEREEWRHFWSDVEAAAKGH
jgi:eukaryotic-like serine/threonine-protein kinase